MIEYDSYTYTSIILFHYAQLILTLAYFPYILFTIMNHKLKVILIAPSLTIYINVYIYFLL